MRTLQKIQSLLNLLFVISFSFISNPGNAQFEDMPPPPLDVSGSKKLSLEEIKELVKTKYKNLENNKVENLQFSWDDGSYWSFNKENNDEFGYSANLIYLDGLVPTEKQGTLSINIVKNYKLWGLIEQNEFLKQSLSEKYPSGKFQLISSEKKDTAERTIFKIEKINVVSNSHISLLGQTIQTKDKLFVFVLEIYSSEISTEQQIKWVEKFKKINET